MGYSLAEIDYSVFKDMLEEKKQMELTCESAFLTDNESEKEKHWAIFEWQKKAWQERFERIINDKNLSYALLIAYKLVDAFYSAGERKLIMILQILDIEVKNAQS